MFYCFVDPKIAVKEKTEGITAVSYTLGLTLAQCSASKTNEMTAIRDIIKGFVFDGKIITVDALLTQREISKDILKAGDDYVMMVKKHC